MQILGRHFETGRPIALSIRDGRIASIEHSQERPGLPFIAPGLFDIQINGYGGVWFSDENLTVELVAKQGAPRLHAIEVVARE